MLCDMSERDGFQHGVPCWVDTWQDEVPAAFYSGLFGWEAQVGDEYTLFTQRGLDVAGAGAARAPRRRGRPTCGSTTRTRSPSER